MKANSQTPQSDRSTPWEIRTEEALVTGVGRYRRRQRLKAGVATAALLIVAAFGVTSLLGGFDEDASVVTAVPTATEVPPTPLPMANLVPSTGVPPTEVPTAVPTATEVQRPIPVALGTYAVAINLESIDQIAVFDGAEGEPRTLLDEDLWGERRPAPLFPRTYFGSPLVLRVTETTADGEWLHVQVPVRPNNSTVWVRAADFEVKTTSVRIEASTAAHPGAAAGLLRVFDGDDLILEAPFSSGNPDRSPTPAMNGWVGEVLDGFNEAYGSGIIDIGGHSEVFRLFSGGAPRIAIRGTNVPDMIEERISNGGLRLRNEDIDILRALPGLLGAPVTIHPDPFTDGRTHEPFPTQPAPTMRWDPDRELPDAMVPKYG